MKRKINFLSEYKSKKIPAAAAAQIYFAAAALVLIVSSLALSLTLKSKTDGLNRQVTEIEDYLMSDEAAAAASEADLYDGLTAAYRTMLDEYIADKESVSESVAADRQQILDAIGLAEPDVTVTGVDFSNDRNILTLFCSAKDQRTPLAYVKKLRDSDMFDYVGYTGYTTDGGSDVRFSVGIFLDKEETP